MSSATSLKLTEVVKAFAQGSSRLTILQSADLEVVAGEMVALVGPSGAGKSTLLQIAGLLEKPDSGEVAIGGTATARLRDRRRTSLRLSMIGFVYQYHHLLPEFTALENVVIPQMIAGQSRRAARERARDLLTKVRLGERLDHRPAKLSGGEQQRVAIARALANRPKVLLADEPTGNLDPHTADEVFSLLSNIVKQEGVAALIATHNYDLAERMDRSLRLEEGKVVAVQTGPIDIAEALSKLHEEMEPEPPVSEAASSDESTSVVNKLAAVSRPQAHDTKAKKNKEGASKDATGGDKS